MRLTAVQYIILGIFLVLTYGLWRLQVSQSDLYATLAEKNRIRNVPDPRAARARSSTAKAGLLSITILRSLRCCCAILRADLNADADMIANGLHMDPKECERPHSQFAAMPQYQPIFLKDDITQDELAFIEAHQQRVAGTRHHHGAPPALSAQRLYGARDRLCRRSQRRDAEPAALGALQPGRRGGKVGIELEYNQMLMGKNGSRQAVVNSHGSEMGRLDEKAGGARESILSSRLISTCRSPQKRRLRDKNGAIVAMDPRNGEILAMVSRPTFDPNDFAVKISADEWSKLVNDDEHPLLNKAIQAQLAPGSIFKIIMATAGMQEGIAQNMHVNCTGGATFYGRYFKCWVACQHRGHGAVDVSQGIYQSCDVFFYTLAEHSGSNRIAKYATAFGLGQKTGIDLAAGSQRRYALGGVEDPQLQAEVVCRRNDFGGHRPGCSGGHADPAGARDRGHHQRRL